MKTWIVHIVFIMALIGTGTQGASFDADCYPGNVSSINSHPQQPDSTNNKITLGRNSSYRENKARTYLIMADSEERNGNMAEALRYYFSAIYELEILSDSIELAKTQKNVGQIFHANSLFIKALEYYSNAELIFLQSDVIRDQDHLLVTIGDVHNELGDYQMALTYYTRAQNIQREKGDMPAYILSTFKLVKCYNSLHQYGKSLENNKVILGYFQEREDTIQQISALNNIGFTYKNLGDYPMSLDYFERAGSLEKMLYGSVSPVSLVNKAIVYQNMGNDNMAIRYLNNAAKEVENLKDEKQATEYNHLTALVYFNLKDYHNAIIYNRASIQIGGKINYADMLEEAYLLYSKIYGEMYDYEEAMIGFQKYLLIKDSLQRQQISAEQELNGIAFRVEELARETEGLWASEELSHLELQRLKLDSANRQQELEILHKSDSIQRITIENQKLENQQTRQALLLKEEQVYAARKGKEVDSLRQIEKIQSLELKTQKLVQKDQEAQIKILDKENEIAELNLKKVKTRNKYLLGFAVLAIVIIYLVYRGLRYSRKINKVLVIQKNEIERQKDEIDYERQRSDKLLLNILPEETAEELKEKGAATPKHYDKVSVLFTDFKGFTNHAEKLTPEELIEELNLCFLEFDKIIDKHNLEKIKTIGDAYMCAGGLPVANETNPFDTINAAIEIREFMESMKREREAKGESFWELRIGIHTGPVIAGVVGKNKFAYDIWGDAVNTASRMESSGVPGKVNISGITYEMVKGQYVCTYRGKIKAKNKGEIDMYIVEDKF